MSSDASPPSPAPAAPPPVPVTIITGSLGAGKTSLIRHILTASHGRRICVIENEFADSGGIESLLLTHGAPSDLPRALSDGYYELANGCACCSVRDGLVATLRMLSRRGQFEYILLETSGLADPAPLAALFYTDLDDDAGVALDAVVTIVDAAHVTSHASRWRSSGALNETVKQIALADVIIINKIDLVEAARVEGVTAYLKALNPSARTLTSTRSEVALDALLNLNAYSVTAPPAMPCGDACGDAHHVHDDSVAHVSVVLRGRPVLRSKVDAFFAALLWGEEAPSLLHGSCTILRSKGVLHMVDDKGVAPGHHGAAPCLHVVQTVLEQYDVQPLSGEEACREAVARWGEATSTMIFIGTGLNRDDLTARLAACQVPEG